MRQRAAPIGHSLQRTSVSRSSPSALRLQPKFYKPAYGFGAADFISLSPSVDRGGQIVWQAHGAKGLRLSNRAEGFRHIPSHENGLVHLTLLNQGNRS